MDFKKIEHFHSYCENALARLVAMPGGVPSSGWSKDHKITTTFGRHRSALLRQMRASQISTRCLLSFTRILGRPGHGVEKKAYGFGVRQSRESRERASHLRPYGWVKDGRSHHGVHAGRAPDREAEPAGRKAQAAAFDLPAVPSMAACAAAGTTERTPASAAFIRRTSRELRGVMRSRE